jgi:ubiquinone/menaquinone biosynthesis C-methylase UbiE
MADAGVPEGGWSRDRLQRLDHPDRKRVMPHAPVLEALDLKPGQHVADVGAGLGYFTFPIALQVRPGFVKAIDPSPAAREELRRRADAGKVHGITVIDGTAAATGLPDRSCDRVLWHTIWHELTDAAEAARETHRILRRGGLWVVVDWDPDAEAGIGPPIRERWSRERAMAVVREVGGFSLVSTFQPGPMSWGFVCRAD